MMKKSTFGAVLSFMFAAAGALTAAALYLYHRVKELDESERLLFSDDMGDIADADTVYAHIEDDDTPAAPVADADQAAMKL